MLYLTKSEIYGRSSLDEVEKFIKENKHLPDIPSAKEVAENGISLGVMNAKLLQKIEELTLLLIEQGKKTELQSKELAEAKSMIERLTSRIDSFSLQNYCSLPF